LFGHCLPPVATLFKKLFFLPISLSEIAEISLHFKNYF